MHPDLRSRRIDDSLGETPDLYPEKPPLNQYFEFRPSDDYIIPPTKGKTLFNFPLRKKQPSFTDYNPMYDDDYYDDEIDPDVSNNSPRYIEEGRYGETYAIGGKRRKTHKKKYHKKKSHKKKSHKKKSHKKRHTRKSKKSRKH